MRDGPRPDPEDRAGLLGAVAEEFGYDDRGPLAWGERGDRADGLVPFDHPLEGIILSGGEHPSPSCSHRSPERRAVDIHRRLEEIADRVIQGADAIPPLPHSDERLLHEILCLGRVVRDQQQSPEQPAALHLEELIERERNPKVFRRPGQSRGLLIHRPHERAADTIRIGGHSTFFCDGQKDVLAVDDPVCVLGHGLRRSLVPRATELPGLVVEPWPRVAPRFVVPLQVLRGDPPASV